MKKRLGLMPEKSIREKIYKLIPKSSPLMEVLKHCKPIDNPPIFHNWYRKVAVIKSQREMSAILKDVNKLKELQEALQHATLSDNGDGWINITITAEGFLQQNKKTGRKRCIKKWVEITKIEDIKKENQ